MAASNVSEGLAGAIFQWIEIEGREVRKVAEELGISETEVLASCERGRAAVQGREQWAPRELVLREFGLLDQRLAFLYRTVIAAWRDSGANEKSGGGQTRYLIAAARIAKEMAKASAALAKIRASWTREDQQQAQEDQAASEPPASGFARSSASLASEQPIATPSGDGSDDAHASCDDTAKSLPTWGRQKSRDSSPVRAADSHLVAAHQRRQTIRPVDRARRLKSTA